MSKLYISTKEDTNNILNIRPISILPAMSKVLEKVIFNQENCYFSSNNLFCINQYGSTELAALHLVDDIIYNIINIYSDLSKDFDTCDHDILLNKL